MVVGFLHTSPAHVPTFDALVTELAPGTRSVSAVDEGLLDLARRSGSGDPMLASRIDRALADLTEAGVSSVLCTCSTIGGLAVQRGEALGIGVVRVDRPMAVRAVEIGGRIVVVAAVESTLGPTRTLIESVAADRERAVEIEIRLVAGAWERFEAGDLDGYHRSIADALLSLLADADADVVVLAQASMAPAVTLVDARAASAVPILASPRLAVEFVLSP